MQDLHPSVTELRAFLANEPRGVGSNALTATTLRDYITSGCRPIAQLDTTHAYWWIKGDCYTIMLPEWARKIMQEEIV